MKKILIPVDETESKKALETAKEFALKFDSELIIVHVKRRFEVDATIPWNYDAVQNDDVKKAIHDYARNIVDKTADFFKGTDIKVTTEILDGHIASEICDFAEKNGCDLILINSHGHNAVERFLIGGVTSRVVHHSKIPVLIVR